jgi:hypothetical protein
MVCSVAERSDGRCDIEVALAVLACVLHIRWQRCAPPLMAAFVLACAAVAPAAGPQPNADPLWKAYPLDTNSPAPATTTSPATTASPAAPVVTQRPAMSAPAPAADARLDRHASRPPRAITIVFFGSLAAALLLVGVALIRRRRRPRVKGPVTCEITWLPASEGGAFSATTWTNGDVPDVVAASRRFERRTPGPPDQDQASRQAYAELVRVLMAEGWEPYGRGRAWWEMRLRRAPESSGTPREAIHG